MKIFPPNLPPGSSGPAVLLLQLGLVSAGLLRVKRNPDESSGAILGKYDYETQVAVEELQFILEVPFTGAIDDETKAALKRHKGIDLDALFHEDFMVETLVPDPATQPQLLEVGQAS